MDTYYYLHGFLDWVCNMAGLIFNASGTVAGFMQSQAFVRVILGPVGSGKSTGCLMEILRRAREQEPASDDGIRHTRFAIVRQTLQQIKTTVLKEFYTWASPITEYKVSESTIYIRFADIDCEVHLIPLEDEKDQRRLLSLQLTGAWVNEFPEISPDIIPSLIGRIGRYPSAAQGGATWSGIVMDGNFPNEGGDWHKILELGRPPDWDVWKQPGGMEPNAENLNWLVQTGDTLRLPLNHPDRLAQGRKYYERLVMNNSETWVRRYVHAQYGDDPSGAAVFRESFKREFHVRQELMPVVGHSLIVGQDFGRNPWGIIGQLDHHGRLLVLEEVEAEDMGLEIYCSRILRPRLTRPEYLGKSIAIVGDPSGIAKGNIWEETSFDALKRLGFSAFPAPTNDLDPRLRAVESFLLGARMGGPAILINGPRCPTLVAGFAGGYRYANMKSGQRRPAPEKNRFSHPHDSLQYLCLAAHGGMITNHIAQRLRPRATPQIPTFSPAAWT